MSSCELPLDMVAIFPTQLTIMIAFFTRTTRMRSEFLDFGGSQWEKREITKLAGKKKVDE